MRTVLKKSIMKKKEKVCCELDPSQRLVSRGSRDLADVKFVSWTEWNLYFTSISALFQFSYLDMLMILMKITTLNSLSCKCTGSFPTGREKPEPVLMLCLSGIHEASRGT